MRYESIQSLRAVAALMVVLHHFLLANLEYGSPDSIANFYKFASFGAAGVDLFFCISGFVMLASVQKDLVNFNIFNFLFRRAVRIIPLYWISTLGFMLLVGFSTWQKGGTQSIYSSSLFSVNFLLKSLFLFPVINPLNGEFQPFLAQGWTLSYEFLFYFCLAISIVFVSSRSIYFIVAVVCALIAILFYFGGFFPEAWGYFLGNNIIFEFLFGIFSYFIVRRGVPSPGFFMLIGGLSLVGTIFIENFDRVLLWGVPSAMILIGVSFGSRPNIFSNLLRHLGDASFSIYLTHGYFTYVYGGLLKRGFFSDALTQDLMVFAGVLLSSFFGWLVFLNLERPILKYLKMRTWHV